MLHNLKFLVNGAADLTVALLILVAFASIYVFIKIFKSDFSEMD